MSVSINPPSISVEFQEALTATHICERVRNMSNPQVVLWYFGANGVKENGVTFYRDNFMDVVRYENKPTMWLYDMTAWAALKNTKIPLTKSNSIVDQVETYHTSIKCIRSSKVFADMQSVEGNTLNFLKERVVTRENLKDASQTFKNNNLTIREVFKEKCPILEGIYDCDTAKTYSVLQYLELFFLLERIISELSDVEESIDITFALPNDESKYYQDNPVEEDIKEFLNERLGEKLNNKNINVHILCFKYSTESMHRPYNAPGNVLKKNKINQELVLPKC